MYAACEGGSQWCPVVQTKLWRRQRELDWVLGFYGQVLWWPVGTQYHTYEQGKIYQMTKPGPHTTDFLFFHVHLMNMEAQFCAISWKVYKIKKKTEKVQGGIKL